MPGDPRRLTSVVVATALVSYASLYPGLLIARLREGWAHLPHV